MKLEVPEDRIAGIRGFNRFYTGVTGLLAEGLLRTPYSLTQARVVFELAQRESTELTDLRRTLDLDPGYLSRILARFEADGLVTRERSATDARRQVIRLTDRGRGVFRMLDDRSRDEVRALLSPLGEEDQRRLLAAMETIRVVLGDRPRTESFVIRPLRPGDLGWVVHRHGVLYAEEFGWDERFEALVARIVADHSERRDPRREDAWIAEVDGEPAGCVFCVADDDEVARLRLLLVEPWARGRGIGARLVEECLRFAEQAGYRRITLWTNDVLTQARRLYERAGFRLVREEPHRSYGHDLVGQDWSRSLE